MNPQSPAVQKDETRTMDDALQPLSKTERASFVEDVRGEIIGDYTVAARLYSIVFQN